MALLKCTECGHAVLEYSDWDSCALLTASSNAVIYLCNAITPTVRPATKYVKGFVAREINTVFNEAPRPVIAAEKPDVVAVAVVCAPASDSVATTCPVSVIVRPAEVANISFCFISKAPLDKTAICWADDNVLKESAILLAVYSPLRIVWIILPICLSDN